MQVGLEAWVDGAVAVEGAGDLPADGAGRVGVAEQVDAVGDRRVEGRGHRDRVHRHREAVEAEGAKVARRVRVPVVERAARLHRLSNFEGRVAPVPAPLLAAVGLGAAEDAAELLDAGLAGARRPERRLVLVGNLAEKAARVDAEPLVERASATAKIDSPTCLKSKVRTKYSTSRPSKLVLERVLEFGTQPWLAWLDCYRLIF